MKRFWFTAVACLAMGVFSLTVSAHADLQLKLLRSFNISSIFNGSAEGCGDAAIDPAFDGTNVFVAGFRSTSGAGPVGILRIDNVLSLPSGSLSYGAGVTKIFGWNAAGVGRDTRMFYYDGYLYAGFGLGQGTNPDTAIVRLNPYGVVDQLWSGDGILSLADVGVSRYDTIALDPGYAGSGPALAVGTLNIASQQAIRRVSLSAGMLLGTSNTVAPTYLRDIAFAPNGDVYMYRGSNDANDGIFKAVRTGVNSFDTPVRLIPFDTGNYQEHRVIYVPVSQVNPALPDLLVYNFRFSPTDPASHKIYIADVNGNRLGEWDGSGVTEDGVEVGGFNDSIIGVAYYITEDGRVLLFVVGGQTPGSPAGTIDRLSVLELVSTTKVSGTVTLNDYVGDVGLVPVLFEIRNPGETDPLETHEVYLDSTGAYEFSTTLRGTYDVAAKASHWLRQVIPNVNLTAPVTLNFSLTNGDIDGDNEVTLLDFGSLVAAFGSVPGDSNWNPNADLDGDDEVTLLDFGVLVRNFGLMGDE